MAPGMAPTSGPFRRVGMAPGMAPHVAGFEGLRVRASGFPASVQAAVRQGWRRTAWILAADLFAVQWTDEEGTPVVCERARRARATRYTISHPDRDRGRLRVACAEPQLAPLPFATSVNANRLPRAADATRSALLLLVQCGGQNVNWREGFPPTGGAFAPSTRDRRSRCLASIGASGTYGAKNPRPIPA
jgi:hypothetical protein